MGGHKQPLGGARSPLDPVATALYRMLLWGTANKTSLNALKISQNSILRMMWSCFIYTPASELYRALDFLNLDYSYEL